MNPFDPAFWKARPKVVTYIHVVFFSVLVLYAFVPYFYFFKVNFSWQFVTGLSEFRWGGFFDAIVPKNIYSVLKLLFPLNASALLVLLAFRPGSSSISAYAYSLLAICAVLRIPLYYLQMHAIQFDLYFVLLLLTPIIIAIPAFAGGLWSKQPLVGEKEPAPTSAWVRVLLFPVLITETTLNYARRQGSNAYIETIAILLGLSLAAKTAELIYDVLILGSVVPIGVFIVFWVAVIALAIWLAFKIFGKSDDTVTTTTRTTILGQEYLSHTDNTGAEIARTDEKTGFLGDKKYETRDAEGNIIAESEEKEGFFGDRHIEHRDSEGKKIGTSEEKDSLFGKEIEHRDEKGNIVGTSQRKPGLFGDGSIETTKK